MFSKEELCSFNWISSNEYGIINCTEDINAHVCVGFLLVRGHMAKRTYKRNQKNYTLVPSLLGYLLSTESSCLLSGPLDQNKQSKT
jgi:hypothetical protein